MSGAAVAGARRGFFFAQQVTFYLFKYGSAVVDARSFFSCFAQQVTSDFFKYGAAVVSARRFCFRPTSDVLFATVPL